MDYAILIWKDPDKMANITPAEKDSKPTSLKNAVESKAKEVLGDQRDRYVEYNPDMLIDKDAAGDDAITSVDVSFELKDVKKDPDSEVKIFKTVRIVKIHIKGNLYLPIKESDAEAVASSIMGKKTLESKKKNTLQLAEWAMVQPTDPKNKAYYRGIVISVMTKAGDFRVISANNVYVENYKEDYSEGEFGTFEIFLSQREDVTSEVKVAGLDEESQSVLDQIKGAMSKAADKAGKVAAVVGTVGVVGKVASTIGTQVIKTVDTFVGETEASRRAKQAMGIIGNTSDATSSVGKMIDTAAHEKDMNKKIQSMSKDFGDISEKVNESAQDGFYSDVDVKNLKVTEDKVKNLEEIYKSDLTPKELEIYEMQDNAGKLEMLLKKKELAEHKIEVDKNKAIIDGFNKK